MRDYKGYRLYTGIHFGTEASFITRNDSDRVWGIGRVFNDTRGVVEARACIERWEQDPGDPWRDGHLFNLSEYTNVRELEIDPSQREDRYVVEASTADPGYNYILRDTETNEFSSYRTEFNAKHTAIRLNDGTYNRAEYTWRKADDTPEEETVSEETDYKAAYEKTIEALRKEAEKRGWCTEFDEFVKDNNLPETLTETKVRVTLELTIPRRTVNPGLVREAIEAHPDITKAIVGSEEVK